MHRKSTCILAVLLLSAVCVRPAAAADPQAQAVKAEPGDTDKAAVVASNNRFAVDLFARLGGGQEGNLFFSPSSIHAALSMTYAGAAGKTAEQIKDVLDLPDSLDETANGYQDLLADLNDTPEVTFGAEEDGKYVQKKMPAYRLHMANALWPQKGCRFKEDYITLVSKHFDAAIEPLDYRKPEPARKRINDWVAKKTQDRIKNLIGPGVLNPGTRLVLTNAVYFKSSWASDFSKSATEDGTFHLGHGKTATVPMMHQADTFKAFQNDQLQGLSLPYKGHELDMVILLPRKKDGLAAMEKTLTAEKLTAWLGKLTGQRVRVTMPRWKLSSSFALRAPLSAMGMADAFAPGKADFSGMTEAEKLFISAVLHKAFIAVDEEGTEAAAATAVVMEATAMPPAATMEFTADHPFLYLIRHRPTGTILFMGRLANPAGKD